MQRDDHSNLVSVIIPCFNHAHYLEDAIRSALAQGYSDVEVIVVDDASTDATPEVAARFPAVRYLRRQTRGGLAAARNTGLGEARGRYVVFLDADDWLLPDALASGVACLAEPPEADIAFGGFRNVAADGSILNERRARGDPSDIYGSLLKTNIVAMVASAIFRRSALQQAGGFDATLRACEDYDLLLRLARTHRVRQHTALVACYRRHGNNMSLDNALMLKTVLRALKKQRRHVGSSASWHAAYRQGYRFGQRFYGAPLFDQTLTQLRRRQMAAALRNAIILLAYARWSDLRQWMRDRPPLPPPSDSRNAS